MTKALNIAFQKHILITAVLDIAFQKARKRMPQVLGYIEHTGIGLIRLDISVISMVILLIKHVF